MEVEGGKTEGITDVRSLVTEQTFVSGTVDRAIPETVPVPMDSTNTRDNDISYLGTSTSHHTKVDAPGTKTYTNGTAPDSKGAAVPDEKCASEFFLQLHRKEIQ